MQSQNSSLLRHVLVPIASKGDGRRTAIAMKPYDIDRITLTFVVEKAGGAPDKLSPTHAQEVAQEAFRAFREVLPEAEDHIAYGTDVTDAIFDVAREIDASAIVFTSHGDHRLMQFLTGNISRDLVTGNDRPVIALPRPPED